MDFQRMVPDRFLPRIQGAAALLAAVLLGSPLHASPSLRLATPQFDLHTEFAHYLNDESDGTEASSNGRDRGVLQARFTLTLDAQLGDSMQLRLRPRMVGDDEGLSAPPEVRWLDHGDRRARLVFDEAWFTHYGQHWQTKLGAQTFTWGTGDLFRPTDILNAVDWLEPLDSRKLGGLAASLVRSGGFGDVQLVVAPFVQHRLPAASERWALQPSLPASLVQGLADLGVDPATLRLQGTEDPGSSLDAATYALRWSSSGVIDNSDLTFSLVVGHDRFGVVEIVGLPASDSSAAMASSPSARRMFPEFRQYGFSSSTARGSFEVHSELAWHDTRDPFQDDDFLALLVGSTYTVGRLPSWATSGLISLEFTYEEIVQDRLGERFLATGFARPFRNTLFARVQANLVGSSEVELSSIYNFEADDWFLRARLAKSFFDAWTLALRFEQFDGPADSFFGQWRRNDRVVIESIWTH